ncbi:MAG: hypothetical protein LC792_28895 [Actinobacteria bacterium]|nr:hypothetical protein [Actinomycetota bacterium]
MEAHGFGPGNFARRLTTETKQAFKTTEFWTFVAVAIGVLIAGAAIDNGTEGDVLDGGKAWLYVTLLTIGYMISRGLAKSGSRDPYWDTPGTDGDGSSLTERVKTAAQVLKDGDVDSQPTRVSDTTPVGAQDRI